MPDLPLHFAPPSAQADIACAGCGYNLRGLAANAVCPECGLGVTISRRGNGLWFSPPSWITKLFSASLLLIASFLIGVFIWIATFEAPKRLSDLDMEFWRSVVLVAYLLANVIALIGIFLLTAREPRLALKPAQWSAATTARITAVTGLIIQIVIQAVTSTGSRLALGRNAFVLLDLAGVVVRLAFAVAVYMVVRRLLVRMNRRRLVWLAAFDLFLNLVYVLIILALSIFLLANQGLTFGSFMFTVFIAAQWFWLAVVVSGLLLWSFVAGALLRTRRQANVELMIARNQVASPNVGNGPTT